MGLLTELGSFVLIGAACTVGYKGINDGWDGIKRLAKDGKDATMKAYKEFEEKKKAERGE